MPRIQHELKLHTLRRFVNKRIVPALILILVSAMCLSAVGISINQSVTNTCYMMLEDTTTQIASELSSEMEHDMERLEALADVIEGYSSLDGAETQALINAFMENSSISELALLLPDNKLRLAYGECLDVDNVFNKEAQKAPFISGAQGDGLSQDRKFIYKSVPVIKSGEIVGVLYEFTNLKSLSGSFDVQAFPSHAEVCVLDSATGDYVIDTRYSSLENIYTDENRDPDNLDQFSADLQSGNSGHTVIHSRKQGEDLYAYYMPTDVDNWAIMLAIPEDVMFQGAIDIRHTLTAMIFTESVLFLIYLGWIMAKNYQQSARKELQLKRMEGLVDIQETLFDAHKTPGRVDNALQKTAIELTAQTSFLIPTDHSPDSISYVWPEPGDTRRKELDWEVIYEEMPSAASQLLDGYSVLSDLRNRKLRPPEDDASALKNRNVESLMLVPIFDSEQALIGILGSANMRMKWEDVDFLESVAHNFMMALENIRSYRIIEEMGMVDALTGLLNRNSYQKTLAEAKDISGCVYLDANGLHDLNNKHGHAAGDAMLKSVAATLRDAFGTADTYRIGGDEYVALCRRIGKEDAENRTKRLEDSVTKQGYHVSVGFAWRDTPASSQAELNELVTEAEHLMYDAKNRYYESIGGKARI